MILLPSIERGIIPPMKPVPLLIACRLVVCLSTLCTSSGCVVPVDRTMKSTAEMKADITELVPIGTAIADARRTMERNGFHCSSEPKSEKEPARLVCQKEKQTSWVTTHTWAVEFSCDDTNSVRDVAVRSWETGP